MESMTQFRASTPQRLVSELADRLAKQPSPGPALRVAIDGADAAGPRALAAALVDPLRERGRPGHVVAADTFWRDAALRLEHGREDVDAFLEWLDTGALTREVLAPLGPGGDGTYIASLRDPATNRMTREPPRTVGPGAVVLVAGALLLGGGLPFDCTVHLALSPAALRRLTDPGAHWTLEAFARYEQAIRPQEIADVVVRVDDPARPAVRV
jgi:hypothetical protein